MTQNKIVKNTSMLYLMNIAKMIFPLVTLPYLARVLSVEGYGAVAYIKATMQYMQLMIDFGFLLSGTKDIVLAGKDPNKLDREVGNIMCARLLLSSIAFGALLVLISAIELLRQNILYTLLSFVVVFLTIFLFDFFFRGIEKMEVITIQFVLMKGISTALTFVFVHNDADILWMPILDICGSLVAVGCAWYQLKKAKVKIKPSGFRDIFAKLKASAIYFFSDIATTAYNALNTLLIGIYLSATEVAYWSLCMQLVGAAQSLYSPITNGIYPHMVRTRSRKLIRKTLKIFLPLVALGCAFTFCVSKYALLIIGGEKYVAAENILRLLIPVMFFGFPAMLFGWPMLGAIGKQKETSLTTVFTAVFQITALCLLIAIGQFNLLSIVILRSITEAVLFGMRYFVYRKNIHCFEMN